MALQDNTPIKLSFTAVALGLREANAVLSLYLDVANWELAAVQAVNENILQKGNRASTRRIFREVRQRLQMLKQDTLVEFMDANADDQKSILLIAACKCYPFLFDFIRTTIADKCAVFDYRVEKQDFDAYWNRSILDHQCLETIADSTRLKIRQVTFRILAEADLFSSTSNPQITPIQPSPFILSVLEREGTLYGQAFLP